MLAPQQLTLAILAGGRATRLGGVPKGLLRCGGRTLIDRLLGLRELVGYVLLVADDDAPYRHLGLTQVRDIVPGKGAPGALVSALLAAPTPWVVAVTCDMPYVDVTAVRPLLMGAAEVTVWSAGQPFPGCYASALGERWRPLLEKDPSVRSLIGRARLQSPRGQPADLRALRSVNTPDDARQLCVQLP